MSTAKPGEAGAAVHADLRAAIAGSISRGSEYAVITVAKRWPARTSFGQRVRIRGSLTAKYLGPTPNGRATLVDLRVDDALAWLARQDRRLVPS